MKARKNSFDFASAASIGIAALIACSFSSARAHAQCITLHQTLVPSDASTQHTFGEVAIDSAGSILAIGAPGVAQSAYVFERSGSDWMEVARLTSSEPQFSERFGCCVALSGDGQTLIVGARGHRIGLEADSGAAYVWVRTVAGWQQQAQLLASDFDGGDCLGTSIALSDDGNTALISAPYKDEVGSDNGAAYVFVRNDGTWTEQAKLHMSVPSFMAYFGTSVSLSANGDVALVGAPQDHHIALGGEAHVFVRNAGVWGSGTLLPHTSAGGIEEFGNAVALSDDGTLAFVADHNHFSAPFVGGMVRVFAFDGSIWSEIDQFGDPAGIFSDRFGEHIAITADGSTAWVCEAFYGDDNRGRVLIFDRDAGSHWTLRNTIDQLGPQPDDRFGKPALDADGSTALIGVPWHDTAFIESGTAYTYETVAPPISFYCTTKINSLGCAPVLTTNGTPSHSAGSGFTLQASAVLNNKSGLFFYSTSASQAVPFQGGWLCVKPPIKRTSTTNSGGNPPPNDCSGALALDFNAYIASGVDPALAIETTVWGQFWSRDPGFAPPENTSLTGAVRFGICF